MSIKKDFIQSIKVIVLALVLSVGISVVSAAWQDAPANPPQSNAPAPINVSSTGQTKEGGLVLNANGGADYGLIVVGADKKGFVGIGVLTPTQKLDILGKIKIVDGDQADKKILASDATGVGSWKFPSELDIVNSGDAQTICRTLGGTWVATPLPAKCNFPGVNPPPPPPSSDPQIICATLGGVWNTATLKCAFNGGTGGPGSGGTINNITSTNNTITISDNDGPTTNIDVNLSKTCTDLGGTWNSTACSFAGTSSSGASFSVCNNNGTVVSGSAPACVGAQANGGAGTSRYRAINCLAPYQSAKMNGTMFYTSGKWSTQMWTANIDCTNGTILVVDMQGGGGSTGTAGVTQINQGSGIILTPSPIITTGTVSADTTYLQRRIAQSCSTGQVMRGANQDGTPICIADATGGSQTGQQICTALGGIWNTGTNKCSIAGAAGTVASRGNIVEVSAVWSSAQYALGACLSTQRIELERSVLCAPIASAQSTVDSASDLSGSNPTGYTLRLGAWGSNVPQAKCTLIFRCLYQ